MTVNRFNLEAADRGREFFRSNPKAKGSQVDAAAPTFNPARRHFQEAFYAEAEKAYAAAEEVRWQVFFRKQGY